MDFMFWFLKVIIQNAEKAKIGLSVHWLRNGVT